MRQRATFHIVVTSVWGFQTSHRNKTCTVLTLITPEGIVNGVTTTSILSEVKGEDPSPEIAYRIYQSTRDNANKNGAEKILLHFNSCNVTPFALESRNVCIAHKYKATSTAIKKNRQTVIENSLF